MNTDRGNIPDPIAFDLAIVDAKVADSIGAVDVGQIMNDLKIGRMKAGLIPNFKRPRLQWRRVVP
jgi:GxxExxY protein